MSNIEKLIDKYEKPYVPGEIKSNETQRKIKQEMKRKNRHLILDELLNEAKIADEEKSDEEIFTDLLYETKPFTLNKNQKQIVRYLIDKFNKDIKQFHRQAKTKEIIMSFMLYAKMSENPRANINTYTYFRENLDPRKFELIICRLCLCFMKETPIVPKSTNRKDHDLLVRSGLR